MRDRHTRAALACAVQLPCSSDAALRFDDEHACRAERMRDVLGADRRMVARRLLDGLAARDILLLHDGNAALTIEGQPLILAVLPSVIEAARERHLRFVTLREARADA